MTFPRWPRQPQTLAVVRQFIVAGSASLSFASMGLASAWPSPILPKIRALDAPVYMNVNEMSRMVSLFYVGSLMSSIPSIYLADSYGRKKTLLYSGLLSILSWLLILVATHAVHLYVARFLAGLQLGTIASVYSLYIGEISFPDIRSSLTVINHFMSCAGALMIYVVGPFVYYYDLALISLVFPMLFNLTFVAMPESPYFYMMKEKPDKARKSLFWLRGGLNNIELDIELKQIKAFVESETQNKSSYKDIFMVKESRKVIIISVVFTAMKMLSGSEPIQVFASMTLPEKTFGILDPNECVIILGLVDLVASFLMVYIVDMFPQRMTLCMSCLGCGFAMLLATVWFFIDENTGFYTDNTRYFPFVMFIIHVVICNVACGNYASRIKSEILPLHVQAKCCAISNIFYGLIGFLISRFYLIFAQWEGFYLDFLLFAISCFLAAAFSVFYVPETQGKTVQEIQDILCVEEEISTIPVTTRPFEFLMQDISYITSSY